MKISIKEPCQQDWSKMRVGVISRHCWECSKEVIDFTKFSKEELISYLIKNRGDQTCGRVLKSQVDIHHQEILITIESLIQNNKNRNFGFLLLAVATSIMFSCDSPTSSHSSTPLRKDIDSSAKVIVQPNAELTDKEATCKKPKKTNAPIIEEMVTMGLLLPIDTGEHPEPEEIYLVENMPEFIGGVDSLFSFIKDNLKYPEYEKTNKIEGTVYVSFTVEEDGKVTNPKIMRSVEGSKNFDEEVIRVVNSMPPWKPAERNGKNVAVSYNLPIKFKL